MKRSAMLDMMASNLYFWNGATVDGPDWNKLDSEEKEHWLEQAKMLLSLMEGGGMLPPETQVLLKNVSDGCGGFQDEYRAANKWDDQPVEDENEIDS